MGNSLSQQGHFKKVFFCYQRDPNMLCCWIRYLYFLVNLAGSCNTNMKIEIEHVFLDCFKILYFITVLMVFRAELKWLWWPYVDLAMCSLLLEMCLCPAFCTWCHCRQGISHSPPWGCWRARGSAPQTCTFKQPCCTWCKDLKEIGIYC